MDEGNTIYLRGFGTFWKQVQERRMVTNINTENMGIDNFKFAKIRFRTSDSIRKKLTK